MREFIYVLFDKNAGIALKPVLVHRNDVAPIREVEEIANNSESIIAKHAADFELIRIATIDLETLEVEMIERAVVTTALDVQHKKE